MEPSEEMRGGEPRLHLHRKKPRPCRLQRGCRAGVRGTAPPCDLDLGWRTATVVPLSSHRVVTAAPPGPLLGSPLSLPDGHNPRYEVLPLHQWPQGQAAGGSCSCPSQGSAWGEEPGPQVSGARECDLPFPSLPSASLLPSPSLSPLGPLLEELSQLPAALASAPHPSDHPLGGRQCPLPPGRARAQIRGALPCVDPEALGSEGPHQTFRDPRAEWCSQK